MVPLLPINHRKKTELSPEDKKIHRRFVAIYVIALVGLGACAISIFHLNDITLWIMHRKQQKVMQNKETGKVDLLNSANKVMNWFLAVGKSKPYK